MGRLLITATTGIALIRLLCRLLRRLLIATRWLCRLLWGGRALLRRLLRLLRGLLLRCRLLRLRIAPLRLISTLW